MLMVKMRCIFSAARSKRLQYVVSLYPVTTSGMHWYVRERGLFKSRQRPLNKGERCMTTYLGVHFDVIRLKQVTTRDANRYDEAVEFAYECWKDVLVVDVGALIYHVRCGVVQVQVGFAGRQAACSAYLKSLIECCLISTVARKICKAGTISTSFQLLLRRKKGCPGALRTKVACCFLFLFLSRNKRIRQKP